MARRDVILTTIQDLVSNFLYYDRKEDDSLRVGEIEEAIQNGEITEAEIVQAFKDNLTR